MTLNNGPILMNVVNRSKLGVSIETTLNFQSVKCRYDLRVFGVLNTLITSTS